jgi:tetratricopeptide (TPR) repeat protein
MKLNNRLCFLAIIALLFSACKPSANKHSEAISKIESEVYGNKGSMPPVEKTKELIKLYRQHFLEYPDDTASAEYLFKAAELSNYVQDFNQSVNLYDTVIKHFPNYRRKGDCMFLKAYVYDTHLQRISLAQETYNAFLKAYPSHPLADDAQMALQYLGKSNEEILQLILKKNQDSTSQTPAQARP